jgi:hypothetical protein
MLRNHRTSRHPLARGVRRTVLAMGLVVGSVLATAGVASAGAARQFRSENVHHFFFGG